MPFRLQEVYWTMCLWTLARYGAVGVKGELFITIARILIALHLISNILGPR